MKNSKLLDLLSAFSEAELAAFRNFLRSPYFNSREELIRMFDYLHPLAPAFPQTKVRKEKVFKATFPGKPYDEKQLAYRMNYLLELGKRFISIQSFEASGIKPQLHLLESLANRKQEKEFQFVLKKIQQQHRETKTTSSEDFYSQFRIGEICDLHFMNKDLRRYDPNLEIASDQLDRFYFSKKLRMLTEMINRQHIFQQTYDLSFQEMLLESLQDSELLNDPLINAYYHILKMLTLPEKEAEIEYKQVKTIFQDQFSSFSSGDRENILSHLLNFCIQQIRERVNRRPFLEEALDWYMFGIETKIYLSKGVLSPWHFKNIIKLAFNLGKFDWAEKFMYQYSPILQEEFRENALYYNLADLHYQKKDFAKAMEFLHQVEFTDIHYQLNAKLLLIKIYYEIDEEEALLSLLASFTIYLKRNKYLSNDLRKTYGNFCQVLTRILRRNPKKWPGIKKDILNLSPITDRKWLMWALEQEAGSAVLEA